MSDRIAHRPRYRTMHQNTQPSFHAQQKFLRARWTYRKQSTRYEKHPLGYGLSLIPLGYRIVHNIIALHA